MFAPGRDQSLIGCAPLEVTPGRLASYWAATHGYSTVPSQLIPLDPLPKAVVPRYYSKYREKQEILAIHPPEGVLNQGVLSLFAVYGTGGRNRIHPDLEISG
jgi:hypothetical protein